MQGLFQPRQRRWLRTVRVLGLLSGVMGLMGCGDEGASTSSTSTSASSSTSSSSTTSASTSSGGSSSTSSSSSSSGLALAQTGATLYHDRGCHGCHGEQGEGNTAIVAANWSAPSLTVKIRDTMPQGASENCDEDCAAAIAAFILTWVEEPDCQESSALLPRRLRLLTPREYQLTVNDLLGLPSYNTYASALPRTELIRGYDNNVPDIQTSAAHATQYWEVAETLSENLNTSNVVQCTDLSMSECAQKFATEFIPKAFRRPVTQAEIDTYSDLFLMEANNERAIRLAVKSVLISPHFLYRSEIGTVNSSGIAELTPHEVASLLSYTFWGSMPDDELFGLAANGTLLSTATLVQQTERLLASAKAKSQMNHFAEQWLGVDNIRYLFKDPNEFPGFTSSVSEALATEFDLFFNDAFFNKSRVFADLYLTDTVFANAALANFYGISGVTGSQHQIIPAGPHRGGLLNLGGLLASHAKMDQTSPIARGVFVRERLLCQEFPPPPANAGGVIPLNPNLSTRERFSAHTDNEGCRDCHIKIDPIGFAFERYDGAGQYREVEGNNLAVDDAGSVTGLTKMADNDAHPFNGTKGLAAILAHADSASLCFVDQFHSYVQGVAEPTTCEIEDVHSRWQQAGFGLYDLWLETVKSPNFIRRKTGESL